LWGELKDAIAKVEWGTLPDWLAAVGTITAVAVALWLASAERRHREITDARTAARGLKVDHSSLRATDGTGRHLLIYNVSFSNASAQIFRAIRVEYSDPRLVAASVRRLGPGATTSSEVGRTLDTDEDTVRDLTWTVRFRDERGRRWVVDREGTLRRLLPRRPWRWRRRLD
jgi:hypothetical protein